MGSKEQGAGLQIENLFPVPQSLFPPINRRETWENL
jgi:hypothetical protein